MTPDARFVAFVSGANDLTTNDVAVGRLGGFLDVFVRDRASGQTVLVSATADQSQGGNGDSISSSLSDDGRFVAFQSSASNLVTNDANNASDVFLRELLNGTTTALSVRPDGLQTGNASSSNPILTPDGRFVLFESAASDLVPGDTNQLSDLFLRDLERGVTTLVTVGAKAPPGVRLGAASLSTNGQRVAFSTAATNLVSGVTNVAMQIYVRDIGSGLTLWASREAAALTGQTNPGDCAHPEISADGRYVVFECAVTANSSAAVLRFGIETGTTELVATNSPAASDFADDTSPASINGDGRYIVYEAAKPNASALYRWDGETHTISLVSADMANPQLPAAGHSTMPQISLDGRFVTFLSDSLNLVTNRVSGDFQGFQRDIELGLTRVITIDQRGEALSDAIYETPLTTEDGQFAVFTTTDANLGPADSNQEYDLYGRDLRTGAVELISAQAPTLASVTANGFCSLGPLPVSQTGQAIVFESGASNLVGNDTNGVNDVFFRNLGQPNPILISVNTNGWSGNGASRHALISASGAVVAFISNATDLTPGDTNGLEDLYIRDVTKGATVLASQDVNGAAAGIDSSLPVLLSADGHIVCFASVANRLDAADVNGFEDLFWRDMSSQITVRVNSVRFGGWYSASADARYVAYADRLGTTLVVWDSQTKTDKFHVTMSGPVLGGQLSPDGDTLYYFLQTGQNTMLHALDLGTRADALLGPATLNSQSGVALSSDGRWAAYVSTSAPFDAGDTNSTTDIVLWDHLTKQSIIASRGGAELGRPNGASDSPTMSADGRQIAFRFAPDRSIDPNGEPRSDILVYNRDSGQLRLLTTNNSGTPAHGLSSHPKLSADGSMVVFQSAAPDLVPNDRNEGVDIFAAALPEEDTLRIRGVVRASNGDVTLTWAALPGHNSYEVQFTDDLSAGTWTKAAGVPVVSGSEVVYTDGTAGSPARRFYRVASLP